MPAIAEIVPTLGAEQLETLERRYASNNRDFANDYLQDTPRSPAAGSGEARRSSGPRTSTAGWAARSTR